MKKSLLPQPTELSAIIEEAYVSFLQNAPGDLLARLLLRLSLGIRIGWIATSTRPIKTVLVVGFVETAGSFATPSWDDFEPDRKVADYVPDSDQSPPLSIDDYFDRWHITPSAAGNGTGDVDDLRRTQFESKVANMPGLRALAVATLEARIDDGVREKLFEIADEWIYYHPER